MFVATSTLRCWQHALFEYITDLKLSRKHLNTFVQIAGTGTLSYTGHLSQRLGNVTLKKIETTKPKGATHFHLINVTWFLPAMY